jgi:hypothetical protein
MGTGIHDQLGAAFDEYDAKDGTMGSICGHLGH